MNEFLSIKEEYKDEGSTNYQSSEIASRTSPRSLRLSKKEIEKAKKRAKADGFFETEDNHNDFKEVSDSALVF